MQFLSIEICGILTHFCDANLFSSSVASAGQVNMPEMEFLIKDQLLEEYRPGAALRLGDKLKYEIHLNNEGRWQWWQRILSKPPFRVTLNPIVC